MKHNSYPKIGQYRNAIRDLIHTVRYDGKDDDGNPIYNKERELPTIEFKGTVKLHGTNASVCYNHKYGFYFQSRNNIITVDNDNAGFAKFANQRLITFQGIMNELITTHNIDFTKNTICLYGEFAGKGVQKSVAISKLEKSFYIFGAKVVDEEGNRIWLDLPFTSSTKSRIFTIDMFDTYSIKVDLNEPKESQNKLIELTNKVEEQCPVAKYFGEEGVGEGIVWTANYLGKNFRFKVKGEKHSVSKVKKLASVDPEKLKSIKSFIEYAVTDNRLNQAIENVFPNKDLDVKKTGEVIRWMARDIIAEESDTLESNNLSWKEVASNVAKEVKTKFFKQL